MAPSCKSKIFNSRWKIISGSNKHLFFFAEQDAFKYSQESDDNFLNVFGRLRLE